MTSDTITTCGTCGANLSDPRRWIRDGNRAGQTGCIECGTVLCDDEAHAGARPVPAAGRYTIYPSPDQAVTYNLCHGCVEELQRGGCPIVEGEVV